MTRWKTNLLLILGTTVASVAAVVVVVPYAEKHPAPPAQVEAKKPERIQQIYGDNSYIETYVFKDKDSGTEVACFTYQNRISCVVLIK